MRCYRCGNPLGSGKYCLRCGADVTLYRRIVRLSNRYYNRALEKARVRDLSGAAEELSRALEIDKRNIQARNLLGLVLYEMGETVRALCEWVVSENYQKENNPASAYVKYLQDKRTEFETAGQGIRKFNFALDYAKKGSEDLAIIQLEWVVQHHPKMLKAHNLLALLYHSEGKYSKAEREIRTVLRTDVGNTFALNMAREMSEEVRTPQVGRRSALSESAEKTGEKLKENGEKVRKALEGRPAFLLRVLLTAALLLLVAMGILSPTLSRQRSQAVSEAVARYSEELESVRSDLSVSSGLRKAYAVFLEMYRLDPAVPEDLAKMHSLFEGLTADLSRDELYVNLYKSWQEALPAYDQAAAARLLTTEAATEAPEPDSTSENESTAAPSEPAA